MSRFWDKLRINLRFVRIRRPPREFTRLQVDSNLVSETRDIEIDLTRIIRILYNISMAFVKPFNRTSMESKRINVNNTCISSLLLIEPVWNRNSHDRRRAGWFEVELLIEPVWNRNLDIDDLHECEARLLIEPVWNRNAYSTSGVDHKALTFNRTSMESKHQILPNSPLPDFAFNRTSMESKQSIKPELTTPRRTFNRTSMESKHDHQKGA